MEGDEHDRKDDPAVFVNVTGAHAEHPVWRLERGEGGRQLDLQLVVAAVLAAVVFLSVPRQSVMAAVEGAGHHAAGVEPDTGLNRTWIRMLDNNNVLSSSLSLHPANVM